MEFEELLKTTKGLNTREYVEAFAERMNSLGYCLNFSIESLDKEIDKILDREIGTKPIRPGWEFEPSLSVYIGETLRRNYNGIWQGSFLNTGGEFYTSFVLFGEYRLYPSHFIQYRISNGKNSEGTFADYLKKVKPEIISRKSNFKK